MPKLTEAAYMAAGRAHLENHYAFPTDTKISNQSYGVVIPASIFGENAEDRLFEIKLVLRKQGDLPANLQMEKERTAYVEKLDAHATAEAVKQEKIARDTEKRRVAKRKDKAAELAKLIAAQPKE